MKNNQTAGDRLRELQWAARESEVVRGEEAKIIAAAMNGGGLPAWVEMLRRTADAIEAVHKENESCPSP